MREKKFIGKVNCGPCSVCGQETSVDLFLTQGAPPGCFNPFEPQKSVTVKGRCPNCDASQSETLTGKSTKTLKLLAYGRKRKGLELSCEHYIIQKQIGA